jgi:hypothetical protein
MPFSITVFRQVFLGKIVHAVIHNLVPNANKRFRKYVKSEKTQDQPINANFQTLVNEAAVSVLREMEIECWTAITEHRSDTHLETDSFILQLDAKGCLVDDNDFEEYKPKSKNAMDVSGLKIHLGLAQHTRTFTELLNNTRTKLEPLPSPVAGKQLCEIDGKPVYTLVSFLKWGYTDPRGYFVDSVGIAEFPHENDVYAVAGKQKGKELRFIITNPALYLIHSYASESAPQIQDSTPSDNTEHQAVELPTP